MTLDDGKPDTDWTSRELSILSSAALDVPPEGASERAIVGLQAAAALGIGAVGGASAKAAASGLGVKTVTLARLPLLVKWVGVALVGGGVVAGVVGEVRRSGVRQGAEEIARETRRARAVPPAASVASNPAVTATPGEPPPVVVPPAIEPRAANAPKAVERKNALVEEIRSIDLARGLLRKGDARGALAELDRYEALARRGGSMRSEATIVRIEALRASGDVKGATALGERFLLQHPKSPYRDYVKSMLAGP